MKLPFVSIQSIKGGKKLSSLSFWPRRPETVTFHKQETGEPVVVEDYFTYVLGYTNKDLRAGDRVYMKQSDALELFKLLKREFGT